jgi:cytochrome c oxidase subunit II
MVGPWAAAPPRASRRWCGGAVVPALLFAFLALSACDRGGDTYPQTTFRPVSEFGEALNAVFYNTFWWTIAILILVIALVLYAAVRFREQPGGPPPAQIHGNTRLELAWTLVPAFVVILISIPTVRTIFATQQRPPEEALVVEVIGHQWWWEFRYPQYQLTTANLMYIPTGRPISLVMHSADVIHSFWIPQYGGKRDVNPLPRRREGGAPAHPNYITFTVDEPGYYLGQCAEFCGEAHGLMRMSSMAVAPPEFDAWVQRMRGSQQTAAVAPPVQPAPQPGADQPAAGATPHQPPGATTQQQPPAGTTPQQPPGAPSQQPPTAQTQPVIGQMPAPTGAGNPFRTVMSDSLLQAEGRRIFLGGPCVACHAIVGTTARGTIGPNLTLFGTRPHLAAGTLENTRDNLVRWIKDPPSVKPGALMPGTLRGAAGVGPTGLSDVEVRAVAAYLFSLR